MQIRFINLDDCFHKNQRMLQMLSHLGFEKSSERFPGALAINAYNGMSLSETGCLQAHHSLLKSINNNQTTVILEDDVLLSNDFSLKISKLIKDFESSKLDLIFLGQTVLPHDISIHRKLLNHIDNLKNNNTHHIIDATNFYRYGAFAYAVNGKSLKKINNLFESLDMAKNAKAIDVLLGSWIRQGFLSAGVIVPYLAGVDSNLTSTMHDRKNAIRHRRYAELVNLYCKDYSTNAQEEWREILANQPNERALDICKALYLTLTEK